MMGRRARFVPWLVALLVVLVCGGVAGAAPVTLVAVADGYVYELAPDTNFGSNTALRTDNSPFLRSFLRFDAQGLVGGETVTVRLFAATANGQGVELHTVADTAWTESAITFDNAPPIGPVIGSSGPITPGTWISFDVTSQVTSNGPVSFALTSPSNTATRFSSREGTNPPELVLSGGVEGSSPYVVTRSGSTYAAQSQTNGTTFTGSLKVAVEAAVADLQAFAGGDVIFGADTYDFGSDHFEFDDVTDVTFSGAGMGMTVLQNASNAATDTEPFDFERSDRITIRDMTVSAGGPARNTSDALDFDGGDDVLVERVEIIQSRGRGIVFDGKDAVAASGGTASRNTVRDCLISGVPKSGIELLAANENLVEGCTITDVGGHGIQINKASPGADQPNKPSSDNVISANTITNSGIDGVNITSGDNNHVLANTITNSSDDITERDGVRITSGDGIPCDANVVEGNVAFDDQAVQTQRHGLSIVHSLCTGTVVGDNDFVGNLSAQLLDQGTNTVFTDTSAPTAPANLQTSAVNATSVTLTWEASTDNYAVAGYTITRDGSPLGTTTAQTLTFTDTTVSSSTTYTYTVTAFDAAGNNSPASNTVTVTTAGAATTTTLVAVADGYVYELAPDTNFGSNTALRTDNSPFLRSFLRFDAQGLVGGETVTVRLFAATANGQGVELHTVADTAWTESAITFDNAPPIGPVIGSSGPITPGTWISFDVTSQVTSNGPVSFALTSPSNTATRFSSREGTNPPELVVHTEP